MKQKKANTMWRWQDLKYPFGSPEDLTFDDREMGALKNIITIAKERVWLHKTTGKNEFHRDFDQIMTDVQVNNAEITISVCEEILNKHKEISDKQ